MAAKLIPTIVHISKGTEKQILNTVDLAIPGSEGDSIVENYGHQRKVLANYYEGKWHHIN